MDRRHGRTSEAPELKALDVDGVRTVAIITVLWGVAFIVLALRRSDLEADGRGWWIWACLAGVGLGLLGLEYCRKRRDAIARAELGAEADAGFDEAGEWADGELAALAAEGAAGGDFNHPAYPSADATPPGTPLPPLPPSGQEDTGQHAVPYGPGGRPPPGYVTGDLPVVPPEPAQPAPPPRTHRPAPPPPAASPQRPVPPPPTPPPHHSASPPSAEPVYPGTATPAGYSPDPDQSRRHPRDEELARRYREEQARAAAAGYEPPSYPEFLRDEASLRDGTSRPATGEPSTLGDVSPGDPSRTEESPPAPRHRSRATLDSEFFSDEPATDAGHGADFLLDDDEPDGGHRGR